MPPAMPPYSFVAARYDYGPAKSPPLALLIHMAEGGGTVGYLARAPMRGVSVHFVAEYSGRIVQMLPLDHASGSLNPRNLRTTDDPPFVGYNGQQIRYGATAAQAVLGAWWHDPNSAVASIEVEGFAASGPNLAQRRSLVLWSRAMRARFPGLRGNLGHRDFTTEKACPGRLIPWANMGGHGLYAPAG